MLVRIISPVSGSACMCTPPIAACHEAQSLQHYTTIAMRNTISFGPDVWGCLFQSSSLKRANPSQVAPPSASTSTAPVAVRYSLAHRALRPTVTIRPAASPCRPGQHSRLASRKTDGTTSRCHLSVTSRVLAKSATRPAKFLPCHRGGP